MTEPVILFVKPRSICDDDRAALQAAGVIVVSIDDPQNAKFTRAYAEVTSTEMLGAAIASIQKTGGNSTVTAFTNFGEAVARLIAAKHPNPKGSS